MWFSVVCNLVDNDTRYYSGQNAVQQIKLHHKARFALVVRELKHARFWDADGNRKRTFPVLGNYWSPRFLYYLSLMEKWYLAM